MSIAQHKPEFEKEATNERQGLMSEFVDFLKHNKKWWLLPIVLVVVALGALVFLTNTGIAPFIYTLF